MGSAAGVAVSRLKRRPEFLRVAGARRKWVTPGMVVQARRRGASEILPPGAAPVRVGLTASRKVGGAVVRNRVRRRLRAVVERVIGGNARPGHAKPGFDFVVIGRQATAERPFLDLVRDLETALRRLGAWAGADDETTGGTTDKKTAGGKKGEAP